MNASAKAIIVGIDASKHMSTDFTHTRPSAPFFLGLFFRLNLKNFQIRQCLRLNDTPNDPKPAFVSVLRLKPLVYHSPKVVTVQAITHNAHRLTRALKFANFIVQKSRSGHHTQCASPQRALKFANFHRPKLDSDLRSPGYGGPFDRHKTTKCQVAVHYDCPTRCTAPTF